MSKPLEKTQANGTSFDSIAPAIKTAYLQQLTLTHRARARRALRWRARFLSALSSSCSFTFAARVAKVSYNTFLLHQRNDPDFARQVAEAEEQAVDLLHARCIKAVIEGELEPVYFQGKIVGHVRKFDARLAIELLRAHLPDKFKTPGSKVENHSGKSFIGVQMTEKERDELVALRQEALMEMKPVQAAPAIEGGPTP